METLALDSQKIKFVKTFLNERNENVLKRVMAYFEQERNAVENPPCRFSVEEMRERIINAEEEINKGWVVPHEAILRKGL
jgi:hypothetical protein